MERDLRDLMHLQLLERTVVQFQAPTQWLTTTGNSSSRTQRPLLGSRGTVLMRKYPHKGTQIHTIKNNESKSF